jgi:2-oxoglutarate dehydrogenase E1 component
MQVINPSTGAQIFHALRRQVRRNFRKPLIVMTPKSLLRKETSRVEELINGRFQEVIDDPRFAPTVGVKSESKFLDKKGVKNVLLCSGKLYWELAERRDELAKHEIAIVRLEQFYPLNAAALKGVLDSYPKTAKRVWVQEEPRNMGAYLFVRDAVQATLGFDLPYIGRPASASPAVGSKHVHKHEQEDILEEAVGKAPPKKDGKDAPKAEPKPAAKSESKAVSGKR